jgi:hypothetical protein
MNIKQLQEKLNTAEQEFEIIEKILEYAQSKGMKKVNVKEMKKWYCGECGEIREGDDRVLAGMKCYHCAY